MLSVRPGSHTVVSAPGGRLTHATASVAVHALLLWSAIALNDRARAADDSAWHGANFLAPPDRLLSAPAARERLHFVRLDHAGEGAVPARAPRAARPAPLLATALRSAESRASSATTVPARDGADSVYTVLDVDSAARRYAWSAAPVYPRLLLERGIEGTVETEYVVDTTGLADTATFRVFASTHADFTESVRAALPDMRFVPAKIGNLPVRLLVQQTFSFRVRPAPASDASLRGGATQRATGGTPPD